LRHTTSAISLTSRAALVTLTISLATVKPTAAEDITGILRVASNYDYRGYSKSDNHPSSQANIDYLKPDTLFFGAWFSSVNMQGARLEMNPYLGKQFVLSQDWQAITSLGGYFFDDKVMNQGANYGEALLQLDYRDLVSFRFNIAPDYYGRGHAVTNYEFEVRHPLADNIEVSAGIGYLAGRKSLNYDSLYSNIRIAWFIRPDLTFDLNYSQLHEMNERPHDLNDEGLFSDSDLDSPIILAISFGF